MGICELVSRYMPAPIDSEQSEELASEKTLIKTWAAERASATPEAHEVQEVTSSDLYDEPEPETQPEAASDQWSVIGQRGVNPT